MQFWERFQQLLSAKLENHVKRRLHSEAEGATRTFAEVMDEEASALTLSDPEFRKRQERVTERLHLMMDTGHNIKQELVAVVDGLIESHNNPEVDHAETRRQMELWRQRFRVEMEYLQKGLEALDRLIPHYILDSFFGAAKFL